MKVLMYTGNRKQLIDHGFTIQVDISNGIVTEFAWRDFKHIDEAVAVVIDVNKPTLKDQIGVVRALYNHPKNRYKLKEEVNDLIDDELITVKENIVIRGILNGIE